MKQLRASIVTAGLASALLLGAASDASAWRGGRGARAGSAAPSLPRSGHISPSPDPRLSGWNWPIYTYHNPMIYTTRVPSYFAGFPAAPVVSARSVGTTDLGMHCATEVKTCRLRQPSTIGGGCSCKIRGGRIRGSVVP